MKEHIGSLPSAQVGRHLEMGLYLWHPAPRFVDLTFSKGSNSSTKWEYNATHITG